MLSLDGFTAAYRLSKYMLSNSVVLKEESIKIEYYYRSLVPWKHYIPVFRYVPVACMHCHTTHESIHDSR